jgi:hypothetical protein
MGKSTMFLNRRSVLWFAAGVLLCGVLATSSLAGKGGKGKGGGGGDDGGSGGGDTPPPVGYAVTWLQIDGGNTLALDVNATGEVVGYYYDPSNEPHPFLYSTTSGYEMLDDLVDVAEAAMEAVLGEEIDLRQGHVLRSAHRINDAGRIAGNARNEFGERTVYVFDVALDPPLQFAPSPAGIEIGVQDMSTDGRILTGLWGDTIQQFVWTPEVEFIGLPVLSDVGGHYQINDTGQIVGRWEYEDDLDEVIRLSTLDLTSVEILADWGGTPQINDFGDVVAEVQGMTKKTKNKFFASIYIDGIGWQQLWDLSSTSFNMHSFNNAGQISGTLVGTRDTVYVYDPVDGLWSLDDLIDPSETDWFVGDQRPLGMSESLMGYPYIVGQNGTGNGSSFLLTPVE